ncbi:hypothetical protein Bca101_007768 [Brassica carinata]
MIVASMSICLLQYRFISSCVSISIHLLAGVTTCIDTTPLEINHSMILTFFQTLYLYKKASCPVEVRLLKSRLLPPHGPNLPYASLQAFCSRKL